MELRHLGNEEDKALLTAVILLMLSQYVDRKRRVGSDRLQHVLLMEEAHHLVARTDSVDGAKSRAVSFFTNMIAEMRKYGQGIVIVEQVPTLLAEGALKNTVTKIMHRLQGRDDVSIMGATMGFRQLHEARAPGLVAHEGEAFFFTEGLNEAALINLPLFPKEAVLSDRDVATRMSDFKHRYQAAFQQRLPFTGCDLCRTPCKHRVRAGQMAHRRDLVDAVSAGWRLGDERKLPELAASLAAPIFAEIGEPRNVDLVFCVWLHLQSEEKALREVADNSSMHRCLTAL